MTVDVEKALEEFQWLKTQNQKRNRNYYLNRQAVRGNFRWPNNWPSHIEKEVDNLCKPIVERHTQYLMGKGFNWNIDRPNTLEFREAAERAEKILKKLERLSKASLQHIDAAKNGSMLGRSVYKVWRKGKKGREYAAFANVQPDYIYGVSAGGEALGEYSTLYYSYPIDILEAKRLYGDREYRSEAATEASKMYTPLPEELRDTSMDPRARRIPVLEMWTKDDFLLIVGGHVIQNGENPYRWTDTGEGFIPFVIIDNIRNAGESTGEADIEQSRLTNERLNWLNSRKTHLGNRYLVPTLLWEGAPANAAEVLAGTIGGGGAIPMRLGSRISFLSYDRPNPMVTERQEELRRSILETAGMNELSFAGQSSAAVNTGPGLQPQFQPVIGCIEQKRKAWDVGLSTLYAMLLEIQEQIGDSDALGEAVVGRSEQATEDIDALPEGAPGAGLHMGGELVKLSGKDIKGLRDVLIYWPGILPKDDLEASRLEMEKASRGLQSIYTTLERLGVEHPADEIDRIRMENQDPNLKGELVAEQTRANMPLLKEQQRQEFEMWQAQQQAQQQGGMGEPGMMGGDVDPLSGEPPIREQSLGDRLRALAQSALPEMGEDDDEELSILNGV